MNLFNEKTAYLLIPVQDWKPDLLYTVKEFNKPAFPVR